MLCLGLRTLITAYVLVVAGGSNVLAATPASAESFGALPSEPPPSASATSTTTTVALPNTPAMLRGGSDTYQFTGKFPGGTATLHLDIQVSTLVELDTSTVTVEVDGVPTVTDSVRHFLRDGGVALGAPTPGFHVVAVVIHLQIQGLDHCALDFREKAWLVLAPTSTLTTPVAEGPRSYQDLLQFWFERKAPVTISFAQAGAATTPPELVVGYLQIDSALRSHGFAVQDRRSGGPADVDVVIDATLPRDTVNLSVTATGLRIVAKRVAQLGIAGQVLADPQLAAACAQWPCEFGDLPINQTPPLVVDQAVVAQVSEQFPGGFRAAGPGQHRMRMQWSKPLDTELTTGAELRLMVRAPPTIAAGRRLRLDVDLAGMIIESFDLVAGSNEVRLPLPITNAVVGMIEVGVMITVTEPPSVSCGDDQGELWAWIDPTGALVLPRKIQRYDGIASFFTELTHRPVLLLDEPLTWDQTVALGPILGPLAQRFSSEPWVLAATCGSACVKIHPARQNYEDVQPMAGITTRAPYKAPAQAMLVRSATNQLELWSATRPTPVPDFSALLTTTAISTATTWTTLGVAKRISVQQVQAVAPATSHPVVGQREQRRRRFVWIWSAIAVVILLGLSKLVTRTAR